MLCDACCACVEHNETSPVAAVVFPFVLNDFTPMFYVVAVQQALLHSNAVSSGRLPSLVLGCA